MQRRSALICGDPNLPSHTALVVHTRWKGGASDAKAFFPQIGADECNADLR